LKKIFPCTRFHLPRKRNSVLGNSAALVSAAGGKTHSWFAGTGCPSLRAAWAGCRRARLGGSLLARLEGVFGGPPVAVVGAPEQD
jgi:hypothetical protein